MPPIPPPAPRLTPMERALVDALHRLEEASRDRDRALLALQIHQQTIETLLRGIPIQLARYETSVTDLIARLDELS